VAVDEEKLHGSGWLIVERGWGVQFFGVLSFSNGVAHRSHPSHKSHLSHGTYLL